MLAVKTLKCIENSPFSISYTSLLPDNSSVTWCLIIINYIQIICHTSPESQMKILKVFLNKYTNKTKKNKSSMYVADIKFPTSSRIQMGSSDTYQDYHKINPILSKRFY